MTMLSLITTMLERIKLN
ncbi:hypothetical protein MFRU_001g00920 [Monilinia fructicola]|nr:hypothetical protein MFRU_001g00920 [Monilinia fructicola]